MPPTTCTPSCSYGASGDPWYASVALDDVEVATAADGTRAACRVLGVPVARVAYKDLRAICAKLAVAGYKNKRKSDMARLIADKKAAAAWPASTSEIKAPGSHLMRRPATSAAERVNRLCIEYPRVMTGTLAHSFLARGGHNDGDSRTNRVAVMCRRPPRVELHRVANSIGGSPCATPSSATPIQRRGNVSPPRVVVPIELGREDFGCQASIGSPRAARHGDAFGENCSTSGSSSTSSDDIHFVTPSSQESSSTQDPVPPERAVATIKNDENASLETWFKVSNRITALRTSLKAESDQKLASELRDDIAFLVRKKRRITKAL